MKDPLLRPSKIKFPTNRLFACPRIWRSIRMRNDLHFFPTPRRVVHVIKIHFFPPILSLNEMKKQGGMHRVGRMYKSRRRIDPPTGVAEGWKCGSFSSSTDRHAMNDDSRVMADQTPTKQLFFFLLKKYFLLLPKIMFRRIKKSVALLCLRSHKSPPAALN